MRHYEAVERPCLQHYDYRWNGVIYCRSHLELQLSNICRNITYSLDFSQIRKYVLVSIETCGNSIDVVSSWLVVERVDG